MSRRASSWIAATLLTLCVLLRAYPFVAWTGSHFDSDQAIVGLMAKHVSEGRAFPLFYYGQHYMLAVEAYLAAPVMWALGPTVTALKLPLVLINVAIVLLLLRVVMRDAGLPPSAAAVAALPFALPAAGLAARTTEANGGNVEPFLYVLLLWMLRERPFGFGALLGAAVLHREFTAYGAAALLVMEAIALLHGPDRRARTVRRLRHWTLAGVAFVASRVALTSLKPFANALGPGSHGDDPLLANAVVDTLGGRLCFEPDTWPARAGLLVTDHLPRLVGGVGAPLRDYGVASGVYSGSPGVGPWVGLLTGLGLAAGAWGWWRGRRAGRPVLPPSAHVGGYLVLVGVISTLVYGFAVCSAVRVETMRYNLLGIYVPIGALVMALQAWPAAAVRAGLAAAVAVWCALNTSDVLALTREYRIRRPPDLRQALADALEARGLVISAADFRTAYHVTFLAGERVRVTAHDFMRIKAYAAEAAQAQAPTLHAGACDGGTELVNGMFACPPPARR